MDIQTWLELAPDHAFSLFLTGIMVVCVYELASCALHDIDAHFLNRHAVARCLGFHSGTMTGECRNHSCPYRRQCSFYRPRRTFREWFHGVAVRLKFYICKGKVMTSEEWVKKNKKKEP